MDPPKKLSGINWRTVRFTSLSSFQGLLDAEARIRRLHAGEVFAFSRASSGESEGKAMVDDTYSPKFTYLPVSLTVSDSNLFVSVMCGSVDVHGRTFRGHRSHSLSTISTKYHMRGRDRKGQRDRKQRKNGHQTKATLSVPRGMNVRGPSTILSP